MGANLANWGLPGLWTLLKGDLGTAWMLIRNTLGSLGHCVYLSLGQQRTIFYMLFCSTPQIFGIENNYETFQNLTEHMSFCVFTALSQEYATLVWTFRKSGQLAHVTEHGTVCQASHSVQWQSSFNSILHIFPPKPRWHLHAILFFLELVRLFSGTSTHFPLLLQSYIRLQSIFSQYSPSNPA